MVQQQNRRHSLYPSRWPHMQPFPLNVILCPIPLATGSVRTTTACHEVRHGHERHSLHQPGLLVRHCGVYRLRGQARGVWHVRMQAWLLWRAVRDQDHVAMATQVDMSLLGHVRILVKNAMFRYCNLSLPTKINVSSIMVGAAT